MGAVASICTFDEPLYVCWWIVFRQLVHPDYLLATSPSSKPMTKFVDLSHPIEDDMPGFRMSTPDGETVELSAEVEPFLTHGETDPLYDEGVSFELSEVRMYGNAGTYLDSPAHRYPGRRDVGDLGVSELILDGVVVDATDKAAGEAVEPTDFPENLELANRAVLFEFGWDGHWGTDQYHEYPFLSAELAERLADAGAALVGVDALNVDDSEDPSRPVHSILLDEGVFVVENLRNLAAIRDREFRFCAIPLAVSGATSMPIRAFAEVR